MLKYTGVLFLAIGINSAILSGCQPQKTESAKEPEIQQQKEVNTEPQIEALDAKLERLSWASPVCGADDCPEILIDRLQSNQPFIDEWMDQQILVRLKSIVDLSPMATSKPKDEKITPEQAITQTALQILEQKTAPYIHEFWTLDQELKALSPSQQLSLMIKPKVLNSQPPLATVVLNSSSYLGGAHGSSSQEYYHFDLESKKRIELKDIIVKNQSQALEDKAYEAFKAWIIDTKLTDNIADYENVWKFKLTNNFYLGTQGLILQYGEYEIGPYVVGLPRLVIAYDQLKGIVKPEYLPTADQAASDVKVSKAVKNETHLAK